MSSTGQLKLAQLLDLITVERLELGPEDILVLKSPISLSMDEAESLTQRLRAHVRGTPVLILDGGADLSVLRALR